MKNGFSFYDLEAWQMARKLRQDISELVQTFPSKEQYRLQDQIVRSSRSVTANIAEGFGRFHYKESMQYYRQARGSLTETTEHLICAHDEKYIAKQELKSYLETIDQCGKLINGLIRSQSKHAKQ